MLGVFLADAYYRRVGGELDAVESWQQRPKEAEFASDVDDMMAFSLSSPVELEDLWTTAWERLMTGRLHAPQEVGQRLLLCCDITLRLFHAVRDCADAVRGMGYQVTGYENLKPADAAVVGLRERIRHRWPWFDEQFARKAREEIAAGLCRTI
jgi:hypothetical protein